MWSVRISHLGFYLFIWCDQGADFWCIDWVFIDLEGSEFWFDLLLLWIEPLKKKLAATMAWRYAASNGSGLAANDMVLVRISSLFSCASFDCLWIKQCQLCEIEWGISTHELNVWMWPFDLKVRDVLDLISWSAGQPCIIYYFLIEVLIGVVGLWLAWLEFRVSEMHFW